MHPSILIEESALKEIKYLLELKGLDETFGIRVGVRGGGCSGLSYDLNFGRKATGDTVMEQEGVKLFVDPKSLLYLTGTTLTYSSGLQGKGFSFNNPKQLRPVGVKSPFSVLWFIAVK